MLNARGRVKEVEMKLHRITAALSVALSLTLALGALTARAAWDEKEGYDPSLGLARISYMTGDVLFYSPDTEEWADAAPNFALREQDSLWVGDDSRAEVRFATGETGWLNFETGLDILNMRTGKDGETYQVALPYGEASFNVKNFDVLGSVFQVDTPSASVRAFGRSLFRVSSLDDGTTQVGVKDGSVEVESEYGIITLRPGDLMEVYASGRSRVMDLPPDDSWDDWVEARLDRYSRSYTSNRYLPKEMSSYSYEFEENGSWVSYPEYGHVWVPRVAVGWSPYSYGRWVYVGYDYVWLPYDPWYAPYHYGRWYWDVSFGWFWIPPSIGFTFWSPGYVGWCYGPDYLYWVPLGPGEIYYGHGYYGPRSVNIFIHKDVRIKNVYINSKVTNAVVAVDRKAFREGRVRRVDVRERNNPFRGKVRDARIVGRAPVKEIKPDRKLKFPKPDKAVPDRLKPPRKVKERINAVKDRRVVTKSRGSAFRDKKPARMKDVDDRMRKPLWKEQGGKKETPAKRQVERPSGDKRAKPAQNKTESPGKWQVEKPSGDKRAKPEQKKTESPARQRVEPNGREGPDRPAKQPQIEPSGRGRPERQTQQPQIEPSGREGPEDRGKPAPRIEETQKPSTSDRGGGKAAPSKRWDDIKRERPSTGKRTKVRDEQNGGGTSGWGRGETAPKSGAGTTDRGGTKIYRETGSDRGSLQRDTSKGDKKGAAAPGSPGSVDKKGAVKKKPQPAVRGRTEGAVKTRAAEKRSGTGAKGEPGAAEKRPGSDDEPAATDEQSATEGDAPGKGRGVDKPGKK